MSHWRLAQTLSFESCENIGWAEYEGLTAWCVVPDELGPKLGSATYQLGGFGQFAQVACEE
jgi:hypothetical protein